MRTTIRLDDDLHCQAKAYAAKHGLTLTSLIANALREMMANRGNPEPRMRTHLPVFRGGGLMPGVDLDDNAALLDLMEGRGAPLRR
ncbi:MAG: hypothetical protein HYT87_03775 [Nitrospirae bacterium]|nr:hypothetical protein [Nitrospirota bacterium]